MIDRLLLAGRASRRLAKFLYPAAVVVLFALAAHARFSLPLQPLIDPDLYGYLGPALLTLGGGTFVHTNTINFVYPAGVLLLLRLFHDFRVIVVVQHLLGLAAGGLFLLSWNRLAGLVAGRCLPRPLHHGIGLVGATFYLLSNTPILMELGVRSDALCMFFEMLMLTLLLWFVHDLLRRRDEKKAVVSGVGAIAAGLLLLSLKPSFLLTALSAILLVVVLVLRSMPPRLWSGFFAAVLLITSALVVPEIILQRGDPAVRTFLPQTLFAIHADIMAEQMRSDIVFGASEYPREWLKSMRGDLVAAVQAASAMPHSFPSLGFNPDALMHGSDALLLRWMARFSSEDAYVAFLRHYFRRAVLQHPGMFARKVGRQLAIFYAADRCPAFPVHENVKLNQHYRRSAETLGAPGVGVMFAPLAWAAPYRAEVARLSSADVRIHQPDAVKRGNQILARAYRPVLTISIALAFFVVCFRGQRADGAAAIMVILLFLPNFGNTLALSVVHTMQVDRYSTVQFIAALFAELWAIRWLADFAWSKVARSQSPG